MWRKKQELTRRWLILEDAFIRLVQLSFTADSNINKSLPPIFLISIVITRIGKNYVSTFLCPFLHGKHILWPFLHCIPTFMTFPVLTFDLWPAGMSVGTSTSRTSWRWAQSCVSPSSSSRIPRKIRRMYTTILLTIKLILFLKSIV